MKAGKLRHRITIQKATEAPNAYGEMVQTWGTFATVSASVEPLRGRELWAAGGQQARVTTRIRIRYLRGVTSKMRVLFGSRAFEIESIIDPEERNAEMQLMCQEWVA